MAKPRTRNTERIGLNIDEEIVTAVVKYQHRAEISTKTAALEHLLRHALKNPPPPPDPPPKP